MLHTSQNSDATQRSSNVTVVGSLTGQVQSVHDGLRRDNCKKSNHFSHYFAKDVNSNYYIHDILEKEVTPTFS